MNLIATMEQGATSLQPCGFVSNLQTSVWFPVFFFSLTALALNFCRDILVQIEMIFLTTEFWLFPE